MKPSHKLFLDIFLGVLIPILVLKYLTAPLGATMAYVVAALIPVFWVFADLLFITRRFNFITSYLGFSALVRGGLTFWFVDGAFFALKDSVSYVLIVLIFGATAVFGRPILYAFLAQGLNPDTPEKESALHQVLHDGPIFKALKQGTWVIVLGNLAFGIVNFILNWKIVVAPFDTEAFNLQVGEVNAITRIALLIPDFIVLGIAFWLVLRALMKDLSADEKELMASEDLWPLIFKRQEQLLTKKS